jgi:hypothetical protein
MKGKSDSRAQKFRFSFYKKQQMFSEALKLKKEEPGSYIINHKDKDLIADG